MTSSGRVHRGARAAVASKRAARRAVEHEMAGDRDRRRSGSTRRVRGARRPRSASGRQPRGRQPSARRRVAGGAGDPAPVGVLAMGRGLDQAAGDDRAATARASASSTAPVTAAVMRIVAPSPSAACCGRGRGRPPRCRPSAQPPVTAGGDRRSSPRLPTPGRTPCRWCSCRHRPRAGSRSARRPGGAGPTGPRLDRGVGQDDRQHRRHVRVDHPDALGDPGDGDRRRLAVAGRQHDGRRRHLGDGIGRAQGLGSGREPASSPSARHRLPSPASTLSSGSRVPMTPVDRWRTWVSSMPHAVGHEPADGSWSASPAAPVAALAQPLVEMTAEAKPKPPRGSSGRGREIGRDRRTGAAANAFGVNTAAAAAGPPVVTMRARSGRPEALIPRRQPAGTKPAGRAAAARRSTDGSGVARSTWR